MHISPRTARFGSTTLLVPRCQCHGGHVQWHEMLRCIQFSGHALTTKVHDMVNEWLL